MKNEKKAAQEVVQTIDQESFNQIVAETAKAVAPVVVEAVKPAIEEALEKHARETEKTVRKDITAGEEQKTPNVNLNKTEDLPASVRLVRAINALSSQNYSKLNELNKIALNNRLTAKAGYGNITTDADGGYVVADPEFDTEVEKLLPLYGLAAQYASIRQTNRNAVKKNKLTQDVSMYRTAEAGVKTGTQLKFSQELVELDKFAAIAPITDELEDDAAIDYWQELSEAFARQVAYWMDRIVFTENSGSVNYKGILYETGTYAHSLGANFSSFDWDDLAEAEAKLPTAAEANAAWYMHKTLWATVKLAKDSEGRYQALPAGSKTTPWGTEVRVGDILPSTSVVGDSNEPYAVYGDLSQIKVYVKRGLELTILKEGTVHDALGNAIHLGEQDMKALRAVIRMTPQIMSPSRFVVLGTGTVS